MNVFFDLDGPILDVSNKYYALYTDLLGEEEGALLPNEQYWALKRDRVPEREIVRRTHPAPVVSAYVARRLALIEDFQYLQYDEVWDGTRDLLATLGQRHRLFIVTMRNRRESLMRELDHLKLMSYFEHVFSRDDNAGTWQVKYDLIEPVVAEGGEGLIIGDTEADIRAGQALDIRTFAVTCGIRNERHIRKCKPDYTLSTALELLDYV